MFSNKGRDKEPEELVPTTAPVTQGKRLVRTTSAPSIISADLSVTGTLVSTGDIQVDGCIEGDVRSAGLIIGEKAFIHGDVMAEEITIRGRVEGGIRAHKVLLANTCHVEGNILHEAFAVETGAFFEGNCRHSEDPLSDGNVPAVNGHAAAPSEEEDAAASAPTVIPRPLSADDTATYTPLKS